jgi:hypothetical protein
VEKLARIRQAEALGGLSLRLTFTDGMVRELDLEPMLTEGVLAALRDPELFATVALDPVAGTVMWPNGVDLDPDVLHGDHDPAQGAAPRLLNQYHLRPTA